MPKFILTITKKKTDYAELVVDAADAEDAVDLLSRVIDGEYEGSDIEEFLSDPGNWDDYEESVVEIDDVRPVKAGEEKNLSYPAEFDAGGSYVETENP